MLYSYQPQEYNNKTNDSKKGNSRKTQYPLSIAPMMDYSDRYFRILMRFITKHTLLYTEMISTEAILHGERNRHLVFDEQEKPLVLQLGGDNPEDMAESARIAVDYGYDEININAGCPSERVKKGGFGVSLMADIVNTVKIIEKMTQAVHLPITMKCRIGLDGTRCNMPVYDSYEYLEHFAQEVIHAGLSALSIHARIAMVGGFSPKQNREIPPLRYDDVYRIADIYRSSHIAIEINGGIKNFTQAQEQFKQVDAVMMGRVVVDDPLLFYHADAVIQNYYHEKLDEPIPEFGIPSRETRCAIAIHFAEYLEQCLSSAKTKKEQRYIKHAVRHLIPLFHGQRGARKWRHGLTQSLQRSDMPLKAIKEEVRKLYML